MNLSPRIRSIVTAASAAASSAASLSLSMEYTEPVESTVVTAKGKAGKSPKFNECLLANPAHAQAEAILGFTATCDCFDLGDMESQLSHARKVNAVFGLAVKSLSEGTADYGEIFDAGYALGMGPHYTLTQCDQGEGGRAMFSEEQLTPLICALKTHIVTQMEETCDYDVFMSDYATATAALIEGFSDALCIDVECDGGDEVDEDMFI